VDWREPKKPGHPNPLIGTVKRERGEGERGREREIMGAREIPLTFGLFACL